LRVRGKGDKTVLIPLPPAVARGIDRAVDGRDAGPILRNVHNVRMDRHAASRRLRQLADAAGIRLPRMHPHMLRHTFVTTMLDAGVSLRPFRSQPVMQIRGQRCGMTVPARIWTGIPTTSSPPTWPQARSWLVSKTTDEMTSRNRLGSEHEWCSIGGLVARRGH
jgi:hypothetical protein